MKIINKSIITKRMVAIFLLGFSSGLPLALLSGTMQAWFKSTGASIITLGCLTLLTQPYSYKFLWAPIFDKFKLPFFNLDKRRSWILGLQLLIIIIIALIAFTGPEKILITIPDFNFVFPDIYFNNIIIIKSHVINFSSIKIPILFLLGWLLAFCSASQDIVIDAHRTEILTTNERGLGAALGVEGYRLGMLTSGGLALLLADHIGWKITYLIMSGFMLIGILATKIAPPAKDINVKTQAILKQALQDLLAKEKANLILIFIILYKIGDVFSQSLTTPFLLDLNFSLTEVGLIAKVVGVSAGLLGIFCGGLIMTRLGLFNALLYFGLLQSMSNLLYMALALIGKNLYLAIVVFSIENLCSGMGNAAFVALLMGICNKNYTATQFALLTSMTAMGRIYVGPLAGFMVKHLGWASFYATTFVLAFPGLLILIFLRKNINSYDAREINNISQPLATAKA